MTNEGLLQRLDQEIDLLHNPRGVIKPTVALLMDCRAALRTPPATGAAAMREACLDIMLAVGTEESEPDDDLLCKAMERIRALPAPEVHPVPEQVRAWVRSPGDFHVGSAQLRTLLPLLYNWIRKEYGL